jgi:hypothetical protein
MNNKNFKFLILLILLFSFIFYSGCATIFSGSRDDVKFASEPDSARVLVNGTDKGSTPITVSLKKGKDYEIQIVKDGYQKKNFTVTYSLGIGWLILDVLAGLIGVIVDAVTGNWNEFEEDSYRAVLVPEGK